MHASLAAAAARASSSDGSLCAAQSTITNAPAEDGSSGGRDAEVTRTPPCSASGISNSTASSDGSWRRQRQQRRPRRTSESQAISAAAVSRYHGTSRSRAAVTTASVPSLPTSRLGRCGPAVSFGSPSSCVITDPSASTACRPITCARIVPKRTTREPPALVLTAPPTVAVARAPQSTAKSRPAAASVLLQCLDGDAGAGGHLHAPTGRPRRAR